jgi:hypothetical protein
MQGIDVIFAALSVVAAVSAASYLWIFLYRPGAFRFSLSELNTLIWYRRVPLTVYYGFASLGLGFMFFKAIESALWWMPTTWMVGTGEGYRPIAWVIAVAIGFGGVNFVTGKMEDIAQRISKFDRWPSCS